MINATPLRIGPAAVLELAGSDAVAFAHSQFSSDVAGLSQGAWQLSAWLDAQGRARNTFLLLRIDVDRLLAWLPRGDVATMAAQLSRYVFRSKVSISAANDWQHLQLPSETSTGNRMQPFGDGWRLQWPGAEHRSAALVPAADSGIADTNDDAREAWQRADIESGLPWLDAELDGICTATSLGLERLAAASTSKGCYPGQEVVARLHFRGGNKRHLWNVRVDATVPPAPASAIVTADATAQRGVLLHAQPDGDGACMGLAVLPESIAGAFDLRTESGLVVHAQTMDFAAHHQTAPRLAGIHRNMV